MPPRPTPDRQDGGIMQLGSQITRTRLARALALLSLAAAVLLTAPAPAAAQIEMQSFYQGYRPTVSREDIDALIATFELDEAQEALVEAIYAGYRNAYNEASDIVRDELRAIQETMSLTKNEGVKQSLYNDYARKREAWADESRRLETSFFADAKALLTEEQDGRWPRFERDRRRRAGLLIGARLMAERVDLVAVLDSLDLADEVREACDEVVERYGIEFDRPLSDRHALCDRMERLAGDADGKGNAEDSQFRSLEERIKRLHVELRDINLRFTEAFKSRLPKDEGGRFEREFRRRVWPRHFAADEVEQDAGRVRSLAGLTPEQDRALEAILSAHDLRMEPLSRELVEVEMARELLRLWPTGRPGSGGAEASGGAESGQAHEAIETRSQRLLNTRKSLMRSTINDIRALLTADQLRALSTAQGIGEEEQNRQ